MRIAVIGIGHSGIVTSVCLCEFGHCVNCYDVNKEAIFKLKAGQSKISEIEPCVDTLIKKYLHLHRLVCYTDFLNVIQDVAAIFITVTQMADIKGFLLNISACSSNNRYIPIFIKTFLPLGATSILEQDLNAVHTSHNLDLIYHPNFFRMGSGIHDFMHPDIIVFGIKNNSQKAIDISKKIYEPILSSNNICVYTNYHTAELIKICHEGHITINTYFYNELSELCTKANADFSIILKCINNTNIGIKSSNNIYAGNVISQKLINYAQQYGINLSILSAAISKCKSNINKIVQSILNESCEKIAIFGLVATQLEVNESPVIAIAKELMKYKKRIFIYSPYEVEIDHLANEITICESAYEAANQADLLVVTNDFPEFNSLDIKKIYDIMRTPKLLDYANIVHYQFTKIAVNQ